jgi:hypothetical protein
MSVKHKLQYIATCSLARALLYSTQMQDSEVISMDLNRYMNRLDGELSPHQCKRGTHFSEYRAHAALFVFTFTWQCRPGAARDR